MTIDFIKMHGLGNDYIYIDCICRPQPVGLTAGIIRRLSDRHTGIGADGVVLILPSAKADLEMRMFNADGSEGDMCGNAIRCVGKYAADAGYTGADNISVDTKSGIKYLTLHRTDGKVGSVSVDMGFASFSPADIHLADNCEYIDRPVVYQMPGGDRTFHVTAVSVGNPHCVIQTGDIDTFPLHECGSRFENHPLFADRVNTEIVCRLSPVHLAMRVWERGSGETMACGTGACAVVAAFTRIGLTPAGNPITVSLRGGDLMITCSADFHITMTGPAEESFRGSITIQPD